MIINTFWSQCRSTYGSLILRIGMWMLMSRILRSENGILRRKSVWSVWIILRIGIVLMRSSCFVSSVMKRRIRESLGTRIKRNRWRRLIVIRSVWRQHIMRVLYSFTVSIVRDLNVRNVWQIQTIIRTSTIQVKWNQRRNPLLHWGSNGLYINLYQLLSWSRCISKKRRRQWVS